MVAEIEEDMNVRQATINDADWIVSLSQRVQRALTVAGSLQKIGPLPLSIVEASIQAGTAYLLEQPACRIGSVLVDPVTPTYPPSQAQWRLDGLPRPLWYLHALMIEPEEQGKGLGRIFLDGIKQHIIPHHTGTIVLDCWAGNDKLRDFYLRAGFILHGVFPEKGYLVAVFVSFRDTPESRTVPGE
jgi:GNAT superfamily N-acetyltransferase